MSGGWNPTVHLFSQSRGKLRFDDAAAGFVPDVFAALLDDADEQRVMELLLLLETEFLGLAPRPSHARRVAEILVEWREVLERKYTGASSY